MNQNTVSAECASLKCLHCHYEDCACECHASASPAERPEQTALPAEEMVKILFPDAFVSLSADMPTPEQAWEDAALRLADRIAACNNYEALKREVALWRSEHDPCPFSLELETLKESLKNSLTVHTATVCTQCGHIESQHGGGYEPACYWETCLCTGFNAKALPEGL